MNPSTFFTLRSQVDVLMDVTDQLLLLLFIVVFFFQAEDGIRDCLLSRGLGDVYKRQDYKGI